MRERMFMLRLGTEESARLTRISEHYSLSGAGVLRMLIKREDDALTEKKPRQKTKRRITTA